MVIIINLLGYVTLIMIMNSIAIWLIGDHLIKYFELEIKYPKIAKYLKYKKQYVSILWGFT